MWSPVPPWSWSAMVLCCWRRRCWSYSLLALQSRWKWPGFLHQRQTGSTRGGSCAGLDCCCSAVCSSSVIVVNAAKSPGPDEILIHRGTTAVHMLLEVFNHTGKMAHCPKPGEKPSWFMCTRKEKTGRRLPVSLSSCVVKTLERIVNQRLQWYFETEEILAPQQSGFRQFHSTEDQATHLSKKTEDVFH